MFTLSKHTSALDLNSEIALRRERLDLATKVGAGLGAVVVFGAATIALMRTFPAGMDLLLRGDQAILSWPVLIALIGLGLGVIVSAQVKRGYRRTGQWLGSPGVALLGIFVILSILMNFRPESMIPAILGVAMVLCQIKYAAVAEFGLFLSALAYFGALASLASLVLAGALLEPGTALEVFSIEGAILSLLISIGLIMVNLDRGSARFILYEGPAGVASRILVPLAMAIPFISVIFGLTGMRIGLFGHSGAILVLTIVPSMILAVTVWWIGGVIQISHLRQRKSQESVRRQYHNLEKLVAQRTEDLSVVNRDLKHAMELGASREQFLRRVMDTMEPFIGVLAPDGSVIEVNRSALEVSGVRLDDIQGKKFHETPWWIFSDQASGEMGRLIQEVASGKTVVRELKYATTSGQLRAVDFRMVPLLDAKGRVEFLVPSGVDIQTRKEFEEQLIKSRIEADIANKAKSAFLAHMSHELRSPLGIILGFLELAKDEPDSAEKERQLQVIERNARQLLALVDEVLDLGKIESGRVSIDLQDVRLDKILEDVASALEVKAQEKGVDLSFSIDPGASQILRTDPLRLKQILLNVIGNAVKYTESGLVTCRVRSFMNADSKAGKMVEFEVEDSGLGISPEDIDLLFLPFSRGHQAQQKKIPGTGLGLVLARRLANLLGGDVILKKSVPGRGSVFSATVAEHTTMETDWVRPTELNGRRSDLLRSGGKLSGMKILVVDDVVENRILISRFLESAGALVTTASGGQEAVILAAADGFDVVLMDLSMPGISGQAATAKLREMGYKTPVIALTAHAMREEKEQALAHGFNDYLTKPVVREVLVDTLARFAHPPRVSA
ncbi:MAG: Sensory/regulatory protein RpfC [Pseudomonadota bacterium]